MSDPYTCADCQDTGIVHDQYGPVERCQCLAPDSPRDIYDDGYGGRGCILAMVIPIAVMFSALAMGVMR